MAIDYSGDDPRSVLLRKIRDKAMSDEGISDGNARWMQEEQQRLIDSQEVKDYMAHLQAQRYALDHAQAMAQGTPLPQHIDHSQQSDSAPPSLARLSPEQQQAQAEYDSITKLVEAQKQQQQFPSMIERPPQGQRPIDIGQGMVGGMLEGGKGIIRGALATPAFLGDIANLGFSPTVKAMGRPDLAVAPSEFKYGYQGATDALAQIPGLGRDPRMEGAGDVGEAVGMMKPGMVAGPLRAAAGAGADAYHAAMAPVYNPPMAPQLAAPPPQAGALPNVAPRPALSNVGSPSALAAPSVPPTPPGGLAAVPSQASGEWPTTLPKTPSGPPTLRNLFDQLPDINKTMRSMDTAPWPENRPTQVKVKGRKVKVGSVSPRVNMLSPTGSFIPSDSEPGFLDKGRSSVPFAKGGKV